MQTLFGLPINNVLYGLLVILTLGVLILAISAIRNTVLFKTGVRNIMRHPAQTSLIVTGLMLATLLISASLITGDTMHFSIKKTAIKNLGNTDEIVKVKVNQGRSEVGKSGSTDSTNNYFSMNLYNKVDKALSNKLVDATLPVIMENAPAAAPKSHRSLPNLGILGLKKDLPKKMGRLVSKNGERLSIDDLGKNEAYLSDTAAKKLDIRVKEKLKIYIESSAKTLTVAGVYKNEHMPQEAPALILPVKKIQNLLGQDNKINTILISNKGDEISGAKYTKKVVNKLKPVLKGSRLGVDEVKKEALDDAEKAASSFTSIFLIFGQFSMIAGVMLIFLIFIMLAAERKVELGVLRALGSQSRDILRIFMFEGSIYAIIAGAIGSVLGIGAGWTIVKVLAKAFGSAEGFKLYYTFSLKSLFIAYAMGLITTFAVVVFSAWRAGHINIVRAIKDLPEPKKRGTKVKRIVLASLLIVFGSLLILSGIKTDQTGSSLLGLSFLVAGIPFLAWGFRVPDRIVFTVAGIGLLLLWLLPDETIHRVFPWLEGMKSGIEMFFISGVSIVIGAVWLVIYNSDIILNAISVVFGKLKGLPPILKIAINYPMKNRFRTGLVLAMFSLIVFTIVFMSMLIISMNPVFENVKGMSGNYNVKGITGYANPIKDVKKTIDKGTSNVKASDFEAIGSFSMAGVGIRQKDAKKNKWIQYAIQGIDSGYAKSTNYKIDLMDKKYSSSREVWKALVEEKDVAVVHTSLVPAKTSYNVGEQKPDFMLSGLFRENKTLPKIYIEAKNPVSGKVTKIRVIGMVNDMAIYTMGGILASQKTVSSIMKIPVPKMPSALENIESQAKMAAASTGQIPEQLEAAMVEKAKFVALQEKLKHQSIPATTFWFRLKSGKNIKKISKALSKTFYKNGLEVVIVKDEIGDFTQANEMMNRLIQGFMGFGLIVGIAALGVIAARSVVERRREIGMLRAIGFRKGMVQNTFIMESSFVALLGIFIGIFLGVTLAVKMTTFMAKTMPGMVFKVPYTDIIVIALLAYGASLLTTYLPARQAAKVFPAEALRYE